MSAPSGRFYAYGMQLARVYALDINGYPAATNETPYDGLRIRAAQSFVPTTPKWRTLSSLGDMAVLATMSLPPTEGASGVLKTARHDYDVHALLTGTKVATVGETKFIGYATDVQPPDVALLFYQPVKDASSKVTKYRNVLIPATNVEVNLPGMGDEAASYEHTFVLQPASQFPWGVDFSVATNGFTVAGGVEFQTDYKAHIVAWKSVGTLAKLPFTATLPAQAVGKVHVVTVNGVADATVAIAVDGVTPTTKPSAADVIVCLYEHNVDEGENP